MPAQPDYTVEIVGSDGEPDMSVAVIGQQLIDIAGATPGQVLTIESDGTVGAENPGTPGAHATTHEAGGTDPVNGPLALTQSGAQSFVLSITSDAAAKPALIVKGAAAQTANLQEWQNTTPTVVAAVDVAGRMVLASPVAISADSILTVGNGSAHPGTGTVKIGAIVNPTFPSSTTTLAIGVQSRILTAAASFTLTEGNAIRIGAPALGANSAVTTNSGVNVLNQGASGVTNAYGVDVAAQSGAATLNAAARLSGGTQANLWLNSDTASAAGGIAFGASRDVNLYRRAADQLKTDDKFLAAAGVGVGNSAAATTLGTVTKKMEVFDASGASLGFVAIYDAIT